MNDVVALTVRVLPISEEYIEGFRNTPTHLVRLRHFDLERWSLALFTYSNEKYSPCVYPNGESFGTVEQAFDVGSVYLMD